MEHPKDCKRKVTSIDGDRVSHFLKNFVAGGIAGAVSRTAVSPLERAKILFQVQNSSIRNVSSKQTGGFDTLIQTFQRIIKQDGIMGLFKGNGTNIIRIVPYSAMQFASYEFFLRVYSAYTDKVETWQRLIAGGSAGVVAATFTYPLDLVRTRLSLSTDVKISNEGVISCMKKVIKNEGGVSALYRGLYPTLLGIAPLVAINFTVYEGLKQQARLFSSQSDLPVTARLLCGGIAGAAAQTATYPLDVLRRRMQSSGLMGFDYTGVIDAFAKMLRNEGWRSFYRGMWPNYLKMVPAISISFVVYESVQSTLF